MRRFEDKVVLITGASAGIGRATAERMVSEGAAAMLLDVAQEPLEATTKHCRELGGDVESRLCDVSREEEVAGAVEACVARVGRLDVRVTLAGILLLEHTHKTSIEQFEQILSVNLTGTFLCCKAALPHLLESKGNIVNTSSTSAIGGMPYGAAYGASKGGVLALTRTLAVEYGKQGLRANSVCPGSIKTAMTKRTNLPSDADFELLKRAMPLDQPRGPEVVASVIAMLAASDGAHVNGESIRIDSGTLA